MKLQDFVGQITKYDTEKIKSDQELSQQIQTILIDLRLLVASVENSFDSLSIAALERFQELYRCYEPGFLGTRTAEALIDKEQVGSRGGESLATLTLEITKDTLLKSKPIPSEALPDAEKYKVSAGTKLTLTLYQSERKHIKITLSEKPIQNSVNWYVFEEHAQVLEGTTKVYPNREQIKLDVAYKSQMDNENNPTGSCNVTSIAMCLEYLKIPRRRNSGQFEDELYEYALDLGLSRHDPNDLAKIARDYGAKDNFVTNATIEQVKNWLAKGNPAVTHGYFTTFGHIIALVGYDSKGFIVHDPYGEWFREGYDRNDNANNEKGKFLNYSYNLIQETCLPDGSFWVHFISR